MASRAEPPSIQEDLTLRVWDGDESAKGELLVLWGARVELAIRKSFPTLSDEDSEDVVAEAIRRFWVWRDKYDPNRATIFTMLFKFAEQVAIEFRSGRVKWQQSQLLEKGVDAEFFQRVESPEPAVDPPDDAGPKVSPLQKALAECFATLSALQRDILQRYADAGGYELDAATVGKDLGDTHKNGVPIPGGTIRTNKSRAWDSMDICMKKKNFDLKKLGYTNE